MERIQSKGERKNGIDRATEVLFWIGLTVEIAAVVIDKSSMTNPVQSLMFRAAFAAFAVRCAACLRQYSRKELLLVAAAAAVALISWRCAGRNELLRFLAFLCALRTVNVRKAAEYTFYVTLGGCLLLVVLAVLGILGEVSLTADYGNGMESRLVLGLGHPNSLHCMALMLLLLGLYLYESRMKLYLYLPLLLGNYLLYTQTDSSMSFLIGTGALVLSLLLHYCRRLAQSDWIYLAGEGLLVLGLLFSVFAATHDPRKDMRLMQFDAAWFSGRIYSLWETIFHEGTLATWKWFGSSFNTYYFDLGWVRIIYWYGIIPAMMVIALTFALLRHFRKTRNRAAYVMLISMVLYTVFEAHLVSEFIGRNYALFLAALYLPEMMTGYSPPENHIIHTE